MCTKPPQQGSGWFVELEQRGGREGKLVAFPQIYLKIRGGGCTYLLICVNNRVCIFFHPPCFAPQSHSLCDGLFGLTLRLTLKPYICSVLAGRDGGAGVIFVHCRRAALQAHFHYFLSGLWRICRCSKWYGGIASKIFPVMPVGRLYGSVNL